MEIGLRTPLIDIFRRREVARDVRLLAAQGRVAPTPVEQIGLLPLLSDDQESDVRVAAEDTIANMPVEFVSKVIARSEVPKELRAFYTSRGIPVSDTPLDDDAANPFDEAVEDFSKEPASAQEKQSMLERLGSMSMPLRLKAWGTSARTCCESSQTIARGPKTTPLSQLSSSTRRRRWR